MTTGEKLKLAEENTNIDPTENQKIVGNYKKGKVVIKGLKITIENPVGSIRSGMNKDGRHWSVTTNFTYGYINGTVGKDGDHIDIYLGSIIEQDFDVYIIDQIDEKTRAFDEHKVMFGFEDAKIAKEAYLSNFEKGWKGFGSITSISLNKFKLWIKNKDAIKYPASKLPMSRKMDFKNIDFSGETKLIKLDGEVLEGVTLKDLQKQAGSVDKFQHLIVEIASPGGSVFEGLSIMVWFDKLTQMGKDVVTVVTANAYSIASLIMLAASYRMISKHGKVMVHNPMIPELKLMNANELENYVAELRELESIMHELYQIFTGLSEDDIKLLMDNETYLSPEEAVNKGFADIVIDIKPKLYGIATNIKKEINMSKTLNILNRVISMVNKTEFVNQLYHDSEGGEIEIFQKDPSTFAKGDRTSVEEGIVELSDGSKLTIKDFVIQEIDRSIDEATIDDTVDGDFNEGKAPEEVIVPESIEEVVEEIVDPSKTKDDMPSQVIEVTESIKTTKETVAKADEEKEVVAKADEEKEKVVAKDHEDEKEKVVAKDHEDEKDKDKEKVAVAIDEGAIMQLLEEIRATVSGLHQRIDELEKGSGDAVDKMDKFAQFEEVATEAIDAIASNTTSTFAPEALAVADQSPARKSIFQEALAGRRKK